MSEKKAKNWFRGDAIVLNEDGTMRNSRDLSEELYGVFLGWDEKGEMIIALNTDIYEVQV